MSKSQLSPAVAVPVCVMVPQGGPSLQPYCVACGCGAYAPGCRKVISPKERSLHWLRATLSQLALPVDVLELPVASWGLHAWEGGR